MAGRSRSKRAKVRGNSTKAQFASGLADIVLETARLWRKHHLGYDQTKYVVEQVRRRLTLLPPGSRRRLTEVFGWMCLVPHVPGTPKTAFSKRPRACLVL